MNSSVLTPSREWRGWRGWHACIGLSLFLTTTALAQRTFTGRVAFDDWKTDAPGIRRLITPADLPQPFATESVDNGPHLIPRPAGAVPVAPSGFKVDLVSQDLHNCRKIVTAPNGDLFIAESAPGRIRALRVNDQGKVQDSSAFADDLDRPFGIAFYPPGDSPQYVYIANTGSVVRFPYKSGDLKASGKPEMIVSDISAGGLLRGGGHWTRDVVFGLDGKNMYVSVGSFSNNDDSPREKNRADVLEYNPDGSGFRIYASGIRNSVGLATNPTTGQIWGSVNERDGLGDNLPPDYITHFEDGGFYGWPWYYIGSNPDPKHQGKHSELASKVIIPDVLIQAHSASLCMTFYSAEQFPPEYRNGAFAAEHGSWNRAKRTGYKVIFVPMKEGKAAGEYVDFLTGFVSSDNAVWGRPVGVAVGKDGSLFVTEDGSNTLWRVTYTGR